MAGTDVLLLQYYVLQINSSDSEILSNYMCMIHQFVANNKPL